MDKLIGVRRVQPLPVFVGRSDFGRWWEIAIFGKSIVKLPIPAGGPSKWSFLGRRSPWWEWPWIEFLPVREGWTLYTFNFVWVYRPSRDA